MRFLILLLFCGTVNAQSIDQSQENNSSGSYNSGTGNVKATARQEQQQAMQQGQSIVVNVAPDSLGAFATSGTPLSTTSVELPDNIIPDNTPNLGLGGSYPANSCHKVIQAGLSIPGLGANGSATVIDKNCEQLEWTRAAYNMGLREAAIWKLCTMEHAAENPYCDAVNDYNMKVALLARDNEQFQQDFYEMKSDIDDLEKENEDLKESYREERMKKAIVK